MATVPDPVCPADVIQIFFLKLALPKLFVNIKGKR